MARTKRTKPTISEMRRAVRIKQDDLGAKLELFLRAQGAKSPAEKARLMKKVNKLHQVEQSLPRESIGQPSKLNRMKKSPPKKAR